MSSMHTGAEVEGGACPPMYTGAGKWREGHVLHAHRCGEVEGGACPSCSQTKRTILFPHKKSGLL